MKVLQNILLIFILFLFISCAKPVINVVKISDVDKGDATNGLVYALPRNVIKIEVVVNCTEQIKGPYAEFAEKYLGLTNVINSNSIIYDIGECRISSYAEPDPEEFYFVQLPKSKKKFKDFYLTLDESGLLINTTGEEVNLPKKQDVFVFEDKSKIYPDIFKSYADLNLYEKLDTIVEIAADTIKKVTVRRSMVVKTPEQKAKDAADFIIKVKENRFNLLSGFQEVNYDKETFRYMNEQLEELENEYRKLFTGISFTKKIVYTYTYLPVSDKPADTIQLFKFSQLKGVLDNDNVYGEPVYLVVAKCNYPKLLENFEKTKLNTNKKEKENKGLYYRFPDYADVYLYRGHTLTLQAKFPIAQYGVVRYLPSEIKNIDMYPFTGTIKNISGK